MNTGWIKTGATFLVAAAMLSWAEYHRPRTVQMVVEHCSPAKRDHMEAIAQRWNYVEPGPGHDLCFHFRGAPKDHRGPRDVSVLACLKMIPRTPGETMDLEVSHYEWSSRD